jgi:hypothetical protein
LRDSPQWAKASSFTRFLYHTQRRTTAGRIPLDKWSPRRRDLYLTTRNTHNKHLWPCGTRTHNLSRRVSAELRLRTHGHGDRRHCISQWKIHLKCDILYKINSQFPSRSHCRPRVHSFLLRGQTRLPEFVIEFQMPHVSETSCLTTACNLPSFELISGEQSYNCKNSVHWSYSAAVSCVWSSLKQRAIFTQIMVRSDTVFSHTYECVYRQTQCKVLRSV